MAGNQLRTGQEIDQDTEEALMKKGRLLLQHLQSLDAKLNPNSTGAGQPLFTTVSFAKNLQLPSPGNIMTTNFSPTQVQGPIFSRTIPGSNLPSANVSQSSSSNHQNS